MRLESSAIDSSSWETYSGSSDCRSTKDETPPLSADKESPPRPLLLQSERSDRTNVRTSSTCSSYDEARNDDVRSIALSFNDADQFRDIQKYFLGLKTAKEAAACTTPTSLRLYYQIPVDETIRTSLPLFLVYQSNKGKMFHFPIIEAAGRWRIQYGESKHVSYPSIHSLLMHHVNYAIVSPFDKGELESFEVWKANASS